MKRRLLPLTLILLLVSLSLLLNPVSAQPPPINPLLRLNPAAGQPLQPMLISSGNLLVNGNFDQGLTGWTGHKLTPGDGVICQGLDCFFQWHTGQHTRYLRGLKTLVEYTGQTGDIVQFSALYYFNRPAMRVRVGIFGASGVWYTADCKFSHRVKWGCGVTAPEPYARIYVSIMNRGGGPTRIDDANLQAFRTVRSD